MARDGRSGEASELLHVAAGGESGARGRLNELLHAELRALAARAMAGERTDHTLQPTALVHEVWVRLFEPGNPDFADRQHFLAVSARVMREVLVDHARARSRVKRGGRWQRLRLGAAEAQLQDDRPDGFDLLALDEALEELRAHAPRQVQVVELRYFGGLSVEEAAAILGISERSVEREWRFARAWLASRLGTP